jgi:DNA-binding GntR family transcriptional regulator
VVQRFDKQELAERYSLRALLEGYAGEMACRSRGPKLADLLEANCDEMAAGIVLLAELNAQGADDLEQISVLLKLNGQFHQAILAASDCALVSRVLDMLNMPVAYRMYQWRVPARRQAVLDYHRKITAAFRKNEPATVREMLEGHIEDVRDFIISTA